MLNQLLSILLLSINLCSVSNESNSGSYELSSGISAITTDYTITINFTNFTSNYIFSVDIYDGDTYYYQDRSLSYSLTSSHTIPINWEDGIEPTLEISLRTPTTSNSTFSINGVYFSSLASPSTYQVGKFTISEYSNITYNLENITYYTQTYNLYVNNVLFATKDVSPTIVGSFPNSQSYELENFINENGSNISRISVYGKSYSSLDNFLNQYRLWRPNDPIDIYCDTPVNVVYFNTTNENISILSINGLDLPYLTSDYALFNARVLSSTYKYSDDAFATFSLMNGNALIYTFDNVSIIDNNGYCEVVFDIGDDTSLYLSQYVNKTLSFKVNIYNASPIGNPSEVIDLPTLLFTILTLPFTFITQAFNLTLFSGTIYEINFGDIILFILIGLILVFLVKMILKMIGH